MLVKDQLGRKIEVSATPERIISLVPSITELIVSLGMEDQLKGVTKFCVFPEHIRKTATVVGGTKSVHFNRVEELQPDLIICNKEENTAEMVKELERIAPVWVSDIATVEDCLEMIGELGDIFDKRALAGAIVEDINVNLADFKSFIRSQPEVKVAYLIWKDPLMVAGKGTYIDHLLKLNNFENIIGTRRYPEVTEAEISEADLILLSSEPFPFKDTHTKRIHTATGKPCILVDGSYFSWYGSRLVRAFEYFRSLRREVSDLIA